MNRTGPVQRPAAMACYSHVNVPRPVNDTNDGNYCRRCPGAASNEGAILVEAVQGPVSLARSVRSHLDYEALNGCCYRANGMRLCLGQ